MKIKITLLLLIFNFTCFAQLEPSKVILKSGDTIAGIIGKIKRKTFKYKTFSKSKPKEIIFSDIDYVQIQYAKNNTVTYRFFPTQDNEKLIPVEELVVGEKVQLYGVTSSFNTDNGFGISINQTEVSYYLKRSSETKLTHVGAYEPIVNNLKTKTLNYFSDCEKLIKKIKEKEFRIRDGLEQIVTFYNENCVSK